MISDDLPRAPARSKELLEVWVQEFLTRHATDLMSIKVVIQDGSDGLDTGLVVVHLRGGAADVYMQPTAPDSLEWETTLTARAEDMTLSPYELSAVATEISVASSLCAFLQFKSLEWDRMTGMH